MAPASELEQLCGSHTCNLLSPWPGSEARLCYQNPSRCTSISPEHDARLRYQTHTDDFRSATQGSLTKTHQDAHAYLQSGASSARWPLLPNDEIGVRSSGDRSSDLRRSESREIGDFGGFLVFLLACLTRFACLALLACIACMSLKLA